MNNYVLEIAANSLDSALAAQAGGAQRVELCAALEVGGITPSYATIELARHALDIDVYVLIRPRGGDCVYTQSEIDTMSRDIETCRELGCDGVVIGALTPQGDVDQKACAQMMAAAGTLGVTFHRAFDLARKPSQALEDVITLGCERILTSGGAASATEGRAQLAQCVEQAGERLTIMPGAGVKSANLDALIHATQAREFHASAKAPLASRFEGQGLPGMSAGEERTQADEVKTLRAALDAATG